jgi:uncharacterized membrane protein YagU involved in acid resistance
MFKGALTAILLAALAAGTLDALAAIVIYGPIFGSASVGRIFRGIASGAFGKSAFEGGKIMAVYGVIFHYLIAFCFSLFYYFIYPITKFTKNHPLIAGILYGVFVWAAMNLLVIPLSKIGSRPMHLWPALEAMAILIFMVGIPVSFIIHGHYQSRIDHEEVD